MSMSNKKWLKWKYLQSSAISGATIHCRDVKFNIMKFPREIDGFSRENMFKGFRGFSQRFR